MALLGSVTNSRMCWPSAVRQKVLLDVVAIRLEQDVGAAQLANLPICPLDHTMAFAAMRVKYLAAAGHLEALLGAGLGLELGHLALLLAAPLDRAFEPREGRTTASYRRPKCRVARFERAGIEHFAIATAALPAGRQEAGLCQTAGALATAA